MANVYWVGGSGVWNTVSNTFWSSTPGGTSGTGSVPTVNDDVFFDRAQTYSVTMTGALNCRSITVSAGTVTFATGTAPTLTVAGSMSLVAGTVWSSTGAITFNSATTGNTITTNGTQISADITFNNATGGWSLGSALTTGSPSNVTLTTGALNLNGFDLTCYRFTSSNTNTRSIAFGSNYIIGTGLAITVANLAIMTNCTFTGDGGFKYISGSSNKQIHCGSTSNVGGLAITPGPNLFITNGTGTVAPVINDFSSFNKIDFTGYTNSAPSSKVFVDTLILSSGGTFTNFQPIFTRTQTWTAQFSKQLGGIGVSIPGGTLTLDGTQTLTLSSSSALSVCAGTLDLGGFDVTCGLFDSSYTNTRSVAFGSNNIVLANATAATVNLSVADATNFSWTGTGGFTAAASVTRTYTFGTTGGSITNAPNFTLTGSGTSVQTFTSSSWFNNINFGSTAFTVPTTTLNIGGNVTLSSAAATYTNLSLNMRGTGSITSNGKTMSQLTVNTAGTITLPAALTSGAYTQTAGTINFAGFNFTTGPTVFQGGTLSNIGTIACTTFSVSGGTFTLTQGTITPSTSFTVNGTFNYNGGTLSPVPTFTQNGGTVTLGQSYALTATGTYTLTSGSLILNSSLTTGIFSSDNANTRSVVFGSNYIFLVHTTAAQTVLAMTTATNFTWTGTGGFATAMGVTRSVDFGGASNSGGLSTTPGPNLFVTSGASTLSFSGSYNNLDFTGSTCAASGLAFVDTLTLATGGTYTAFIPIFTRTQTWTAQFSKQLGGIGVSIPGGTLTLDGTQTYTVNAQVGFYAGTLDLGGVDLTIGTLAGSTTNTRSIAFGANNINFVTTSTGQTNLSFATATNFTWTGTGGFTAAADITRTFTFGTTGGTAANAPNLTLTGSGTAIQTFTTGSWFDDLNFGTTAFVLPTTALNIAGSLTLSSGGTFTGLSVTTVGTGTLTTNGKPIVTLTVNCPGGTTTLGGPLSYTLATATTTLTAGTLDLNGNNLTTGLFASNFINTRAINFGSNYIDLATTTPAATNLAMGTATGFTCTGTGGFRAAADITRSFNCGTSGGNSAGAPNLFLTTGTAVQTISTGSFFNTLDFGTTAFATGTTRTVNINSLVLSSGGTFTSLLVVAVGTGSLYGNSKQISSLTINHTGTTTITNPILVGATATTTLTSGTFDLNGNNFTTGVFSSANTNTRTINFGSNFIFLATTTASITNLAMDTATGFSATGTGGFSSSISIRRTFTCGTIAPPTVAPNLFLTSGSSIPTFTDNSWFSTLDLRGWEGGYNVVTNTNLTTLFLPNSGTASITTLGVTMRGTGSITSFGKTIGGGLIINHSGTTTLIDNFTNTTSTTLTQGTIDLAGNTLTVPIFSSTGPTTRSITSSTGTGIVSVSDTWTVTDGTGFTGSNYTINMTKGTAKTFAGGGGSYGTLVQAGAGALTISGNNTFTDIQATTRPSNIKFTAGTTQTLADFTLSGVLGSNVTINSTTAGSQYTLYKASGTVNVNYLTIQDSNVTGGAYWGTTTSTFVSNNTGWNATKSTGNFMAFF